MFQLLTNILPDTLKPASLAIHASIYILLFLVATYYLKREWRTTSNRTRNKYVLNPAELVPSVSYYSYPVNDIQHIFWSGGKNSTALLCYYFIVLGKPIQPIYITGLQQADQIELVRQQLIRSKLISRYPHLQSRLLPTWYVTSIDINRRITGKFKNILTELPTLELRRLICWCSLARFAVTFDYPIAAGHINTSPLFRLSPRLYESIFTDMLENKLVFPQAMMTELDIKQMALDSKNYFWDIICE